MARYDRAVRASAASEALAQARAKKGEEEGEVGWDIAETIAGIGDVGLMIASLPPLASAAVGTVKGIAEEDAGATVGALKEGTSTYLKHEAGQKGEARADEALSLRREEGEINKALLAALKRKKDKEDEDED